MGKGSVNPINILSPGTGTINALGLPNPLGLGQSPDMPAAPAPPPPPPPPAVMPDPDDPLAKKRKQVAAAQSLQGGGQSTVLSETLGGGY